MINQDYGSQRPVVLLKSFDDKLISQNFSILILLTQQNNIKSFTVLFSNAHTEVFRFLTIEF